MGHVYASCNVSRCLRPIFDKASPWQCVDRVELFVFCSTLSQVFDEVYVVEPLSIENPQ